MSIREELLGFVDLTMTMIAAQEVYFKSRDELDKRKWIKLRYQVEEVAREIHKDYRGVPQGEGQTQGMFERKS